MWINIWVMIRFLTCKHHILVPESSFEQNVKIPRSDTLTNEQEVEPAWNIKPDRHFSRWLAGEAALHPEDVPPPADHETDLSTQLQLILQEVTHLLWVDHVTVHPDLCQLPLNVGVTHRQPRHPYKAVHGLPHLKGGGPPGEEGQEI